MGSGVPPATDQVSAPPLAAELGRAASLIEEETFKKRIHQRRINIE